MKLSRLLILVPALVLVGCKGNNINSSEEVDSNFVSKEVWDSTVTNFFMFRPQNNVTMKLEIMAEGEGGMEFDLYNDNGDVKFIFGDDDEYPAFYHLLADGYDKSKETYACEEYVYDDELGKYKIEDEIFSVYKEAELSYAYCPLQYEDVTYDKASKTFKADKADYEVHYISDENEVKDVVKLTDIEYTFSNNQLIKLTYDYCKKGEEGIVVSLTYKFSDYGITKVNLPEVE